MQYLMVEIFNPDRFTFQQIFISTLSSFVTGVALLFLLVLPFFDFVSKKKIKQRLIYLGSFGFLYVIIYILAAYIIPSLFLWKSFSNYESAIINYAISNFNDVLVSYLFQVAILYAYEYITIEALLINKQKNLEIELNQTKLQILKSQLQPHFLFNALNSVVAIIDESKSKAQKMLINISDILRITLNAEFIQPVTLKEEMEYLKKYLEIEKVRYEDQIQFQLDISKESEKLKLPVLLLQPIIENAIKHGFKGNQNTLTIKIEAHAEQNTIWVKNNGAKIENDHWKTGLTNVSERLAIFTSKREMFRIYQDYQWVVNEIKLQ